MNCFLSCSLLRGATLDTYQSLSVCLNCEGPCVVGTILLKPVQEGAILLWLRMMEIHLLSAGINMDSWDLVLCEMVAYCIPL